MTAGFDVARRRRVIRAGSVGLAMLVAACGNRQSVVQGVQYSSNRQELEMASIMPRCACVTLASMLGKPTPASDPDSNDLVLVSRQNGSVIGTQILKPGDPKRVQTDWAGDTPADVYRLAAYKPLRYQTTPNWADARKAPPQSSEAVFDEWKRANPSAIDSDGKPIIYDENNPLTPMSTYVYFGNVVQTECSDTPICPFGTLNMNQKLHASVGQGEVETHEAGVTLTKARTTLEARASSTTAVQRCGCMALRAKSEAVELKATLLARTLGFMTLQPGEINFIAFDDAGPHADDRYVITALGAQGPNKERNGSSSQGGFHENVLKFSDVVDIVGQMDQMPCTSYGALLPTGGTAPNIEPPGVARTEPEGLPTFEQIAKNVIPEYVPCFYHDLNMNQNQAVSNQQVAKGRPR